MKSYNNVTIVGRAVRNAELKESSASARSNFTLAVSRPYKDCSGKNPTDFLNIVSWGKLAEICSEYIKKGCLVLVNGRIQSRSYEVENETRWITEIVAESINILEYTSTEKEEGKEDAIAE